VAKQSGQKWILGALIAFELIDRRLLAPAWQRSQEEEADLLGVDLMVAAGYNVSATMILLERLGDQEKKEEENKQKILRDEGARTNK
jgi:predicted Zn-dependent protease